MHTSGLVITLAEDPALAAAALRELNGVEGLTLDAGNGPRRAAALEVAGPKAAHDWHDWATALPGVVGLEIAFVHWDDACPEVNHVGA